MTLTYYGVCNELVLAWSLPWAIIRSVTHGAMFLTVCSGNVTLHAVDQRLPTHRGGVEGGGGVSWMFGREINLINMFSSHIDREFCASRTLDGLTCILRPQPLERPGNWWMAAVLRSTMFTLALGHCWQHINCLYTLQYIVLLWFRFQHTGHIKAWS